MFTLKVGNSAGSPRPLLTLLPTPILKIQDQNFFAVNQAAELKTSYKSSDGKIYGKLARVNGLFFMVGFLFCFVFSQLLIFLVLSLSFEHW